MENITNVLQGWAQDIDSRQQLSLLSLWREPDIEVNNAILNLALKIKKLAFNPYHLGDVFEVKQSLSAVVSERVLYSDLQELPDSYLNCLMEAVNTIAYHHPDLNVQNEMLKIIIERFKINNPMTDNVTGLMPTKASQIPLPSVEFKETV